MMNKDHQAIQELFDNKLNAYRVFFAVLSGVLLFLSFPKFGLGVVAWFAFVPLFIALKDVDSVWRSLSLGWISGMTACVGILYWITHVVVNFGHLPLYLGILLMLLLAFYLSLYTALFAAGIVVLRNRVPLYLSAPVLWMCLEYVKSKAFTGFPWENLGYSQFNNLLFIQIADVVGVFGLSFLIVLLNTVFYSFMTRRLKKSFALAAVVFLLWAGVYAYGVHRIAQINEILKDAQGMDVTLVQGNISQSIKWNANYQKETIRIYEELSLRQPPEAGGLIVWPETAVPFHYQDDSYLQHRVQDISVKTQNWFVFGSTSYRDRGSSTDYYNSAYLLSPLGDIRGKYDKVHLVPYGEYVPLRMVFPFVGRLAEGIGDFGEGKGFYPLEMGERKIGVMICYEGILPEAGRMYKNANADLLVNITNDAWFGSTSAPYQHLSMAMFRAVETRLYLVRAANTGISAIVHPTGKMIANSGIFHKDAIHGRIKYIQLPTIYAKYGDWPVGAGLLFLAVFILWSFVRRGR
jgi:apolipoprotein N-acyltransferase